MSAQIRPSGLPILIYCARDSEILYERTLVIRFFYACRIYFFLKNLQNILFWHLQQVFYESDISQENGIWLWDLYLWWQPGRNGRNTKRMLHCVFILTKWSTIKNSTFQILTLTCRVFVGTKRTVRWSSKCWAVTNRPAPHQFREGCVWIYTNSNVGMFKILAPFDVVWRELNLLQAVSF